MRNVNRGITVKLAVVAAVAVVGFAVGQADAANKLIVKDSVGVEDKFVVTDGGFIGVGTSTPVTALNISGGTVGSTQLRALFSGTNASDSGGFLFLRNNPDGTNSLPLGSNKLGAFSFGAMDGSTLRMAAGFLAYASESWTSTSTPTYLNFTTTPSGSTGQVQRMRITSAGDIGIGTSSPTQKLEINGGMRLNTSTTKPNCNSVDGPSNRGTLWFTKSGSGVADKLEVCAKQADENYAWKPLF